jgi:hypothetical protein
VHLQICDVPQDTTHSLSFTSIIIASPIFSKLSSDLEDQSTESNDSSSSDNIEELMWQEINDPMEAEIEAQIEFQIEAQLQAQL